MKKLILSIFFLLSLALAGHAQSWDLAVPVRWVSALPAGCTPGDRPNSIVFKYTVPVAMYICSAKNTWTNVGSGAGGGMAIGGGVTSGTAGSVPFFGAGPVLSENNSKLYWDNSAPFGQLKLFDNSFLSQNSATEFTHFSIGSNNLYTATKQGGYGLNMWLKPVFPNTLSSPYFIGQKTEIRAKNDTAQTMSVTAVGGFVDSTEEALTPARTGNSNMTGVYGSVFVAGNNVGTHVGLDSQVWFGGMSGATYGTSTNYGIRSQIFPVHNGTNPSDVYAAYFRIAGAGGGGTGNLTGTAVGQQIIMDQTPTLTRFSNVYGLRFSGWGASSSAGTTSGAVIYADASTGTTCDGTCYFIQSLNTKPSIFSGSVSGVVNPYNATTWNGSTKFTTEDDVRDKIETLQPAIQFKDEGVAIGTSGAATNLDCTGSALVCTYSSGTVTIASSGAGGMTVGNSVSGGGANRVLFEDGSQNLSSDADLNYDGTANKLIIGNGTAGNGTLAVANIVGPVATSGRAISIQGGSGTSGGQGGDATLRGGTGTGAAGNAGGRTVVQGGTGDTGDGTGGNVEIYGGTAGASNANGGDIGFQAGAKTGSGTNGKIWFKDPSAFLTKGFFDFSALTSSRTFTFPDNTGTLALTSSNVATATALAANGTNCSAGNYPLGVDASGNAEGCTAVGGGTGFTSTASLPGTCTTGTYYFETSTTKSFSCYATNTFGEMFVAGVSSVGTSNITNSAVTLAKIQNATANSKLLGSGAAGSGSPYSEITVGSGLTMTGTTLSASGGSGTVTNTGGNLTSNAVVLGAGTADTKVVTGITTDGTSKLTLGVAGTSVGSVDFKNATSGTVTVQPVTGALGTVTLSLPAATDTLVGKATTDTLTNKTVDAEGTGNVVTAPFKTFLAAAGCNNATAGTFWDLPTSTPAVAACVTGTNIQKGVLQFADTSGGFSAQNTMLLPSDFTGAIDARIIWRTSATSGNVKWSLSTICTDVAATATDDPAFNTASTVTTAAPGITLRIQTSSITGVTATGCTAGSLLHLKLFRDGNDGSDTLSASVDLIGVEITTRRAM